MIAEHMPMIAAACEVAGVEPVRARVVPGPIAEVLPRYVVEVRTKASATNLATIVPDFDRELRAFEHVEGDHDEALTRRVQQEAEADAFAQQQAAQRRCARHRRFRVFACDACDAEIDRRELDRV